MNDPDRTNPLLSKPHLPGDASRDRSFSPLLTSVIVFTTFFTIAVAIHLPGFASPMIDDLDGWMYRKADVFERGGPFAVIGMVPVRPLFMGSLYLNYVATGLDPWWFRVFNALIEAVAGCALAWMILRLLEIPQLSVPGTFWEKRAVAVGFGLLFTVHPLQTFVVLYVWQRAAIMACVFFFSAVAIFIAARSGQWSNPIPAYGTVGLLFFAGLTSKENVATLPIVLLAAELMLFPEPRKKVLKKILVIAVTTAPAFILYMLVSHQLHRPDSVVPSNPLDRLLEFYQIGGLSLVQVILTECRVFFSYLMMMVLPFWHPMQLIQPQIISESLWDPPATALAVGGLFTLLCSAFWLSTRNRLMAFGIFLTLIAVAPESLFIPRHLFFGHRSILPMAGVLIVGAVAVLYALQWTRDKSAARMVKPVFAVVLAIVVVSLGTLTVSQARQWNPIAFWRAAYSHVPRTSARVETTVLAAIPVHLGAVLIDSGDYAEAAKVLREAARLDPESPTVRLNLGLALCKSGASAEGIEILKTLVAQKPLFIYAWPVLADALIDAGDLPEGVQLLNRIAEKNPTDARVRLQMGLAMTKAHNWPEAIKQFSIALHIDPGSLPAMQGLVLAQRQMRNVEQTLAKHRTEVQDHPESADAHYRLAEALLRVGNVQEAIAHFQKALALKPEMDRARVVLGMALLSAGRNAEAIQPLTQAVKAIKGNAELHYALGLALKREGRASEAIQQFKETLAIDPAHPDVREILRNMENPPSPLEPRNAQQP